MPRTPADRAQLMAQRQEEAKAAMVEHHAPRLAVRDKTARLKALRLAKEAEDKKQT